MTRLLAPALLRRGAALRCMASAAVPSHNSTRPVAAAGIRPDSIRDYDGKFGKR